MHTALLGFRSVFAYHEYSTTIHKIVNHFLYAASFPRKTHPNLDSFLPYDSRLSAKTILRNDGGDKMDRNELPLGFGFALAQNPDAMITFSKLPEESRSEILRRARSASSEQEMRSLVNELSAH